MALSFLLFEAGCQNARRGWRAACWFDPIFRAEHPDCFLELQTNSGGTCRRRRYGARQTWV